MIAIPIPNLTFISQIHSCAGDFLQRSVRRWHFQRGRYGRRLGFRCRGRTLAPTSDHPHHHQQQTQQTFHVQLRRLAYPDVTSIPTARRTQLAVKKAGEICTRPATWLPHLACGAYSPRFVVDSLARRCVAGPGHRTCTSGRRCGSRSGYSAILHFGNAFFNSVMPASVILVLRRS